MTALAYTRFELMRTLRNGRLLFFSLGFPVILFLAIAAPNRDVQDLGGSGVSLPLYYMVGLVGFGAMMALISTGARIASERTDGWTRQLRITPLSAGAYLRAKVLTGYAMAALTIAVLYGSGALLGVRLPAERWLEMTGLILIGLLPGSQATHGEGSQNLLCGYLAAVVFLGLVGNALFGAWWLDPLAALLIAGVAVREGLETWHGEGCCATPAHDRGSRGSP